MCQTENKTNCTRANAKDLRGVASSTCEKGQKPAGSETHLAATGKGPQGKGGKLTAAAAISQTLLSLPWMKEGMKHQLPEAAVSVWP